MPPTARRRSLADDVYDALRSMIVTLQMRPGEALVEKQLCDRFSVSRTPLREALLRLADQGLVSIAPQHGTFVAGIDARAVRQAHFLRSNLELPLVRQLCAADHLDLSRPRAVLLEQELQLTGIDFAAFMPLDDAFHRALFELGGMAEIWSVIHARKAQLDRIRFLQAPQDGKVPTLVAEHRAILDAIARHDAPLAEMVLRKHIAGAMLYMEELLLLQPELFETVLSSRPRSAVLQP